MVDGQTIGTRHVLLAKGGGIGAVQIEAHTGGFLLAYKWR